MVAFSGKNPGEAMAPSAQLELAQEIEVALAVPATAGAPLQAVVLIRLKAHALPLQGSANAEFAGEYEGRFLYPADVAEPDITPWIEQHDYQYGLVAQVFPLSMTHFRRELQSMGIDARELPLGLAYA
ncbi:MAG TPA: hypothetical protein VFY35_15995 [Burkholderiaceae bacterium]|nr:hypothetical protein [Burkholderiaceae bacterium]